MYKITEETLQLRGALDTTYIKGKGIFKRGEIQNIRSTEDFLFFQGKVRGTKLYEVEAEFSGGGKIQKTRCTCPAFHSYYGDCKHITALLLFIDQYKDPRENQENRIKTLIEEYQQRVTHHKKVLNFDLNLTISEGVGKIEMGLGVGKTYIIKDIKEFLRDYQGKRAISFGKNFTYDPNFHELSSDDERIISYFSLLLEMRETKNETLYKNEKDDVFQGRSVVLKNQALEGLLKRMERPEEGMDLWIEGEYHQNVRFETERIPANFMVTEDLKNNDLLLKLKEKGSMVPIDRKGELVFYQGKIYNLSHSKNQWVRPLMKIIMNEKSNGIEIPDAQGEAFLREVLPILQNHTDCEIQDKIEQKIIREPLKTKLFLDQDKGKMVAKLLFNYGEIEINPFTPKESKKGKRKKKSSSKILIRETLKEDHLLNLLEEGDFSVEKERCYLQDEGKIFYFLETLLPKLQKEENLSIYYSDDFKKVKTLKENEIRGVISLNHGLDLLECSLDIESIPKEELMAVLRKIQQKARYHRLSDGTFLSFTRENTRKLESWLDEIDIGFEDFEDGKLQLPIYKAFEVHGLQEEGEEPLFEEDKTFEGLIRDFEKVFEKNNKSELLRSSLKLPKDLKASLRNYQKRGFQWLSTLSEYGFGGILADEMGLGKTIQALSYLAKEKEKGVQKPSILVVPTSLVYNWEDEIKRFTPNLKTLLISGSQDEREEKIQSISKYDVIITSYPLIRRDKELYEPYYFHACILDEAQYIKNKSSQSAKAVKSLKGKHRFALTGTPLENNLTELWSIFDFLIPGYLGSYKTFVEKYQKPIGRSGDARALKVLKRKIAPFILRRLKTDVLKELPEKTEGKILVDMTREQQKIYSLYLQRIKGEIKDTVKEKGIDRSQIQILAGLTRLRQISCHPGVFLEDYHGGSGKLQALGEIVEQGLGENHRFLIFSQFTGVLKKVREDLEKKGYSPLYLDGSTPMNQRGTLVKTFNQGEVPIFLISLKAGGTGLNLTSADVVIHLDPWWNPAVESQATDRAHRIGQKKMLQVKKLIARGTIEEKIHQIQEQKKEIVDQIVQKGDTVLTKLSKEELLDLLEG